MKTKKPTKKELKVIEIQKKTEMVEFMMELMQETFGYLLESSWAINKIKEDLNQYGYDDKDLKTEDCDFILQNLLYQCQNVYDSISDNFFFNPETASIGYIAVDDINSSERATIDNLIKDYQMYTEKRLYQFVTDDIIQKIK